MVGKTLLNRRGEDIVDLVFNVTADWSGVGSKGQGTMHIGRDVYDYSAPASMGGEERV